MKRLWSSLLLLAMLMTVLPIAVSAAEDSQSFRYELSIDGQSEKEVRTGDIITVVLHLNRTDSDENYPMYAMQDEIRYDSNFFELVEGSEILTTGIQTTDIAMRDHYREFYMSYLSFGGGDSWAAKTMIGSFQLRVIGTSGVTKITSQDYLVSYQDGNGSYPCEANELTVILSTDCTVRFDSKGGTRVDDVTAVYGETIPQPADPQKDGKVLEGWYRDIDCTQKWDFENDTVSGNMTLYAKWVEGTDTAASGFQFPWWILLIIAVIAALIVILRKIPKKKGKFSK